jgi:hypothetical protein
MKGVGATTRAPFVMVRRDFPDALDSLSDNELRVGLALCRWADRETATWSGTLAQLGRLCGWGKSPSTLRRTLSALRAAGWIAYECDERQRAPYVVRLTGLSVAECVTSASSQGDSMTQPSAPPSVPATAPSSASNGVATGVSLPSQLRHELSRMTASSPSNFSLSGSAERKLGGETSGEEFEYGEEIKHDEDEKLNSPPRAFEPSAAERARLFDAMYPRQKEAESERHERRTRGSPIAFTGRGVASRRTRTGLATTPPEPLQDRAGDFVSVAVCAPPTGST